MTDNFKVTDFFNTAIDDQFLHICHHEGCQTLDFGDAQVLPRQTEVRTSLKVMGVEIE